MHPFELVHAFVHALLRFVAGLSISTTGWLSAWRSVGSTVLLHQFFQIRIATRHRWRAGSAHIASYATSDKLVRGTLLYELWRFMFIDFVSIVVQVFNNRLKVIP
jgi:hypothetical protein